MSAKLISAAFFALLLGVAGGLNAPSLRSLVLSERPAAAPAATAPAATTPAPPATPALTLSPASPTASPASATDPDAVSAAVKLVIQRSNDEQQEAFAKRDPTLMRDTATTDFYNQLVQINEDMANAGVAAIRLVKLEWGPIAIQNATTARATTFETWQTAYADGSTDQSRERNVYTLVLDQGSWKIQSDDHPDSEVGQVTDPSAPASLPGGAPSARRPPGAVAPDSRPSARSDVSRNWAGYAATGGTFTAVNGTWTVPQSQSTASFASGATWVGIGGVGSRDLIQAGTEDSTTGAGRVRYDAWIELLPRPSQIVPLAVHPGDSVSVSISEEGDDQWRIAFANNTTGQTYQTTVSYTSSHSSAEWVEEAPSARRAVLPLDNFGTVQFSGGSAVKDGKTVTIAQAGAHPITMIDGRNNALATPSALTPDGQGFSISRSGPSSGAPATPGRGGFRWPLGFLPGTSSD